MLLMGTLFLQCAQQDRLEEILAQGSSSFHNTLKSAEHEVQIIYGELVGDSIVHHYFNHDPERYFYPASTVKMPVAFAAVKKAQQLDIALDDPIIIDSTEIYPRMLCWDSALNAPITIRNQIQKIFTVSDNSANNILFGWLGMDYINQLYGEAGMDTRIVHQLGERAFSFKPISNTFTRQTTIIQADNDSVTFDESEQTFQPSLTIQHQKKGIGFIDSLGEHRNMPFDFSKKNFVSLENLLKILEAAIRPDLYKEPNPFDFSRQYHEDLISAMSLLPKDLAPYDTLADNYVKFLGYGNAPSGNIPAHITIKNKVGWAYGYLLDVAYFEDSRNEISFFLAAVLHVNRNEIYNDGVYEYQEVGLPFLDELGDLIYQYELRKRAL